MTNPTLTIGTRIRDNDPRTSSPVMTIGAFARKDAAGWDNDVPPQGATHVVAMSAAATTRIRLDRIHTDGKSRRSGWSVVS